MPITKPLLAATAMSVVVMSAALLAMQGPAAAQSSYYSDPATRYYAAQDNRYPAAFSSIAPQREAVEEMDATATEVPAHLRRQVVDYTGREAAGTIVVDTPNTYLYYVLGNGRAVRYGIGVGRDGFRWSGTQSVARKAEWPDWNPPAEMIARQPYLPRFMAGGPTNPLGARALYLGNTIYRIHGTNAPSTIGGRVSSGCIRMLNDDVTDLYNRVKIGSKVVVLPDSRRTPTIATRAPETRQAANDDVSSAGRGYTLSTIR